MTISVAVCEQAQARAPNHSPIAETGIAFMGPLRRVWGRHLVLRPKPVACRRQCASAGPARCVNAARDAPEIGLTLSPLVSSAAGSLLAAARAPPPASPPPS